MTGALEVKTALELIEIAKKQGWIDKLWTVFSKKYTVLVFGTSGVGKTNFITSLTELVPNAIDALNRTKIAEKHRVKILDHPFTFIDTPGEELQAPQRIRVIQEALRKGVSGIINAAAYGYHEGPASKADVLDGGAVRDSYLAQRREIEICNQRMGGGPWCERGLELANHRRDQGGFVVGLQGNSPQIL